jgi:hypothetical protein
MVPLHFSGALRTHGPTPRKWRAPCLWCYSNFMARSTSMVHALFPWRARSIWSNSYLLARSYYLVPLCFPGSLQELGTTPLLWRALDTWSISTLMAHSQVMVLLRPYGSLNLNGATLSIWRARSLRFLLNLHGALAVIGPTHRSRRAPTIWRYSRNLARSDIMALLRFSGALKTHGPSPLLWRALC